MRLQPKGVVILGALVAGLVVLVTRPWSDHSVYPCQLKSSKIRRIVLPADVPVKEVYARRGDPVEQGRAVVGLNGERLRYELKMKLEEAALIKEEISIIEHMGEDLEQAPLKYIELDQAQDAVRRIRDTLEHLEWIAPFSGVVAKLDPKLQPGYAPGKGAVVGELASRRRTMVTGFVPQEDVSRVHKGSSVRVWFPVGLGRSFDVTVTSVSLFQSEDLDAAPFSARFGGEIATKVKDDTHKDTPVASQYLVRIDFPENQGVPLGAEGKLVVFHPPRSLLERAVNLAVRTFRWESVF